MAYINYSYLIFAGLVPVIGLLLFGVNKYLSLKNTYNQKISPFECGLTSFVQTRSSYHVAFILIAVLFLPFDLEISNLLPYSLVLYITNSYGLTIIILFTMILIFGFAYEFNTNALSIKKNHIKLLNKQNLATSIENLSNDKKNNDSLYK